MQEKITQMFLIPPNICECLCSSPERDKYDLSSVRVVRLGGSACSIQSVSKVFDVFPNAKACNLYSNSEYAAVISMCFSKEMLKKRPDLMCSLGKPAYFTQIKLVDEKGKVVQQGEPGEAWGKSMGIMSRYLEQGVTSVEGWLPTGDILKQDCEGYYFFLSRKKDMVKSGGENIYAFEVENVINMHPSVDKCAVFGVPDQFYGEIVAAAIVLKKGATAKEQDIVNFCKYKTASYKKPKKVFFIDEFPLTSIGKVQKDLLCELIIKET